MGEVVKAEFASFAVFEPFLTDLITSYIEVPDVRRSFLPFYYGSPKNLAMRGRTLIVTWAICHFEYFDSRSSSSDGER
jgi:hypothetical protein